MAMQTVGDRSRPLSEINVTPFVDVMLVLLVIFMVTAPLLQYGVQVDLPEPSRQALEIPQEQVVLSIQKDRTIFVDRYKVALKDLGPKLKAIYQGKKEKEIFLNADQSVPYGFVVKVMSVVRESGIDRMGLITESPE